MSNVIAGIIRGQLEFIDEHIARKKEIYERYRDGFKDLPVKMNPIDEEDASPNYWLSCLIIENEAMAQTDRSEHGVTYATEKGKSSPSEILDIPYYFQCIGQTDMEADAYAAYVP